jgi:hypothetical protein
MAVWFTTDVGEARVPNCLLMMPGLTEVQVYVGYARRPDELPNEATLVQADPAA